MHLRGQVWDCSRIGGPERSGGDLDGFGRDTRLLPNFRPGTIWEAGGNTKGTPMPAWTCPRCRKPFEIPDGWETPKICAECREAMRSNGPPKPPVPPKPVAVVPQEEIANSTPARRKISKGMVGTLAVLAVVLVAAVSYGLRENQAYENALVRSRELNNAQDELTSARRKETLERLLTPSKPSGPPVCVICKGSKKNDCPICVDGVADCGGCTDGVSTLGGKAERCFICAGKGKLRCDFCNGRGETPCTFCNATGVQK